MLDQRRVAAQPEPTREQLFTERYETLLEWALQLTHQQRDWAEDLVQDAFVQFMLARTRLEEIENLNGYLRRLLRNMHFSRTTRLNQRLQDDALSIADYETVLLGWTAVEPERRMQAAEQLHQICAYACFRKESSRAGSVLILRFFLDYFPTEIASVLGSSRHTVDQWQAVARREAKVFLSEPNRLRFVGAKNSAVRPWSMYPASDVDLMRALRGMIFSSRQGSCSSRETLRLAYTTGRTEALSAMQLAHVVSCPSCLDAVNTILGLPLLAERYPTEDCSREEPPRDAGGSGGSGGVPTVLPKRFKRQLREVREHKPSELRIVVNGAALSSLTVNSDFSELDLNLPANEPVECVEILSEQDFQLLFLSAAETNAEQWAEAELSEGRTLEVSLQTVNGPQLRVVYNDPVVEKISGGYINKGLLSSPLTIVRKARTKRWLEVLDKLFSRRDVEESGSSSMSLNLFGQTPRVSRTRVWTSPVWLTVVIAAAIIAAFLLYKGHLDKSPTATSLLAQAIVAETTRGRTADRVVYRSINLEIRRSSEGALISRQTIGSWENYDRHQRIQRLYDESGRLIAVATLNPDGSRTLYHHSSKLAQPRGSTPDSLLLDLDDVWQLTPSIQDYRAIISDSTAAIVQERATDYLIVFEKERTIGASRLIRATLTLAKSDLRPIEQTLVVQRGDELREYRFVETKFELPPAKDLPANIFEIDRELKGEASGPAGSSRVRNVTAGPTSPTSAPAFASTELEIDVAYLLSQAKADRNEQVALTRSASGSLRVEGVVDTAERRDEFLRALRPFSSNPAVSIDIRTVAEAAAKQKSGTVKESVREVEDTGDAIAVEEELREYFSRRGLNTDAVDQSVRAYSSRVVNQSYRALLRAVELKNLAARFARVDMRTVSPDARSKWLEMMRSQAAAFERESAALQRELQPVFLSATQSDVVEDFAIVTDADLARAVERVHRLALANNDAIRQAFTISKASSASAFKSPQFKRNLEGAARLSDRISRY